MLLITSAVNTGIWLIAAFLGDFRFYQRIGFAIFYVALILLAVSMKKENVTEQELTPEQELKLLVEKRQLGIITAEEYSIKRAEIISKL